MEIKERSRQGIPILDLKGSLDTQAAKKLDERLQTLLVTESRFIVNCRNLTHISSMGIRSLLVAARIVHGHLVLCEMLDRIKDVFDLSGLLGIIPFCETEDDAVARMKKLP